MFHSLLFIIIICSFILFEHIATSMLLMTLISFISFVIFPLKLRVECVNFTNQRWFSLQHFLVMFKKIYLQFSFFFFIYNICTAFCAINWNFWFTVLLTYSGWLRVEFLFDNKTLLWSFFWSWPWSLPLVLCPQWHPLPPL